VRENAFNLTNSACNLAFCEADYSEWTCYLFTHAGAGITYRPLKGKVPNAWHRFWQRVILGHRWVRDANLKEPQSP